MNIENLQKIKIYDIKHLLSFYYILVKFRMLISRDIKKVISKENLLFTR